jgi:hypothetical protein
MIIIEKVRPAREERKTDGTTTPVGQEREQRLCMGKADIGLKI